MRIKLPVMAWLSVLVGVQAVGASVAGAQRFEVRFEVAQEEGAAVVDRAWLDERVEAASALFSPAGVSFATAEVAETDLPSVVVTRRDRHAFGPRVQPSRGVIHVFVVRSLADVDVAGRFLRGVHWRSRRGGGYRHFVILSTLAGPTVLAHELGHFFGNPHSQTPGNIMSYERRGPPSFDDGQLRRIRRFAQRFVRAGELRPLAR
ncbi:MAG: hypothetical protein AAF411_13435 [Myxococcota bacterium]